MNDNFEKYLPIYFFYERDTARSSRISQQFRSFYFQNKSLEFPRSMTAFGRLFTDLMVFEYHRFVQMVAKHVPVRTYQFSYIGRYSHFRDPDTNKTYGI